MNIQEYISSGILELYAMNVLSKNEAQEVETVLAKRKEVRQELEHIQSTLEHYASLHSKTPNATLKGAILSKINVVEVPPIKAVKSTPASTLEERKVMQSSTNLSSIKRWKYLAAAASILLALSAVLNWTYHNQLQEVHSELASLQKEQQVLADNFNKASNQLQHTEQELNLVQNPNIKVVRMEGVEAHPDDFAYVYWNVNSQEVHVKIGALPKNPTEKQYQLWALKDGKPIDAGVFDVEAGVLKVKNIEAADAFAVTLEPKGGSVAPTLEEMYVMGAVKVI